MKLTIIEPGVVPAKLAPDWPSYPAMFETLLSPYMEDWEFQSVDLTIGDALPDPADLDAVLITGAAAGVYDDEPWMDSLFDFIRWTGAASIPQVGICFGHQAIAKAFGAQVQKSAKGWGIGRHVYDIHARPDWMVGEEQAFSLGVSHQDQVESLPPGAACIASSAFTPFAALHYPAQTALSFQGHPEFSPEFSCALYSLRKGTRIPTAQVDAAETSFSQPLDNDLVGQWMAAFIKECATPKAC